MENTAVITCQNVSKQFSLAEHAALWKSAFGNNEGPVFDALSDISFSVPKGKFVGILGNNGAGKSTLLRVLGSVYQPDGGEVSLHGKLSGIYELGLAGNPELTGRAYAERLLTLHGFPADRRAAMIADAHDFSELGDRFEDPVYTYSAGMSARLFFSVATAGDYDVYLIDEVLSVGDQNFQSKCWRRLRDRVSHGASGVLVTHDWAAILRLCETTHVLQKGRITFSGPSEQAVRFYLYGPEAKQTYSSDIARFVGDPEFPDRIQQGDPFQVRMKTEVLVTTELLATIAIERMQPGFGWETSMMTRKPTRVELPLGCSEIVFDWGHVPLEPGEYRVSVGLLTPNPDDPGQNIVCDGRSWLNGDKAAFRVDGTANTLALPATWTLAQPAETIGPK